MHRNVILVLIMIFSIFTFVSCNSTGPSMVMPGTDGINRITIRSIANLKDQMEQATLTAKLYCKSARRTFLALDSENFDSDSLKQQHIYNENLQRYALPNESYLEFTCK